MSQEDVEAFCARHKRPATTVTSMPLLAPRPRTPSVQNRARPTRGPRRPIKARKGRRKENDASERNPGGFSLGAGGPRRCRRRHRCRDEF